jgi:hypothetical protein
MRKTTLLLVAGVALGWLVVIGAHSGFVAQAQPQVPKEDASSRTPPDIKVGAAAFTAARSDTASSPAQRLEVVPGTQLQRYEKPVRLEPVPGTQLQRYEKPMRLKPVRLEPVPGTQLQRYEKPVRLEPVPGTQLQRYVGGRRSQ